MILRKVSAATMERPPHIWQITYKELQDFPAVNLDTADKWQMRLFLEKLLMTPLLPMETLIDNKGSSWVLLYVQGKFFYYSSSNLTILDTILPYIEKSAFLFCIFHAGQYLYYISIKPGNRRNPFQAGC